MAYLLLLTRSFVCIDVFTGCSRVSRVIYYGPNRDAGYNPCEIPLDCIHPNPGPVKNPCALCERAVRRNHKAICFEECRLQFHIKCVGITVKNYSLMVSGNKSWTCQPCYAKFMHELPFNSALLNSSLMENLNLSTVSEVSEEAADDREDFSFLRKEYRKECIIASYNINSLQSKLLEVKEWLDQQVFDILTIQETKIDRTHPNSQFQVENYKLYRNDRIKGGGGIIVYVRDNIAAVRKRKSGDSLECILLDVYMNNRRIAIFCAYKPSSVDNATFSKELSAMLDEALSFCDTVICTGDLNSDILHPLAAKKKGDACSMFVMCMTWIPS